MTQDEMNEVLDWIEDKHSRVSRAIMVASDDPWTLHGEENLCVACLPLFVKEYMADVPKVVRATTIFEDKNETNWL